MDNRTILRAGIAGTAVAAVCCATPVLVILLGADGLSAWVGGLDYVLVPVLVAFIGVTAYALQRQRTDAACCAVPGDSEADTPGGRR